jgi:hypothetical protein
MARLLYCQWNAAIIIVEDFKKLRAPQYPDPLRYAIMMFRPLANHNKKQNQPAQSVHHIEIKLRDINQLFNTMDPSPFHEKDLDADAEQFIVSWAQEFPRRDPLVLTIHLSPGGLQQPDAVVEQAVQHYFFYRAGLSRMEFRRLMRDGRISLGIGVVFLCACLILAEILGNHGNQTVSRIGREGLTIAGWVAMWRPLQIYLYDWWPLRRRWKIFEKMADMKVEIHHQG